MWCKSETAELILWWSKTNSLLAHWGYASFFFFYRHGILIITVCFGPDGRDGHEIHNNYLFRVVNHSSSFTFGFSVHLEIEEASANNCKSHCLVHPGAHIYVSFIVGLVHNIHQLRLPVEMVRPLIHCCGIFLKTIPASPWQRPT